jgi:hypothetical protein
MGDKRTYGILNPPVNVEEPQVLKRYLQQLSDKLNGNGLITYPLLHGQAGGLPQSYVEEVGAVINSILEAAARLDALSGTVKNYVTAGLQTEVLQNAEDLATVTQQFGTFYDDATAAAWYGLTVKSGELISGFTIGGLDTDTTTPGTAGSFFAINADTFSVGRAIEDIDDPAELAYLQANGLPYGTMYDADLGKVIPAFIIEWNGTSYDIMFNGKVSFTNVTQTGNLLKVNDPISNLTNDTGFTSFSTFYQASEPTANMVGDLWIDTDDNLKVYTWSGTAWVLAQDSNSALVAAQSKNIVFYQNTVPTASKVNDVWFDTDDNYKLYIWSGTSWVDATRDAAAAINSNTTTINGGKLTTGSVTASQIATNTIVASNIAAGAITANEIATGTITATQIAAGTITAAEIAADAVTATEIAADAVTADKINVASLSAISATLGTVSAGVLSASKFQVNGLVAFNSTYPNNTAPMVISQFQAWSGATNKALTFYGASYSTGHRADRFVASTTKFMVDLTVTTPEAWASSYAYIDVTISGNGITTQTVRVRSQNPSCSLSLAASIAQTGSISFSVSFVTSGAIETPTCTLRAFGFNTE